MTPPSPSAPPASTSAPHGTRWFDQLRQDLRYTVRHLLRFPGFTATVVVTLALAIGACTVVFTAINSTLLRPLAGERADRDVIIHETMLPQRPQMQLSPPTYLDLESSTTSFEIVGAWLGYPVHLAGDTEPLQIRAAALTPGVLQLWGAFVAMGRPFTPEEYANREPVVLLSHSLWQRAFGGDADIIGRAIEVEGTPTTVVGVLSPRFARYGSDLDLWVPLAFNDHQRTQQRGARYLQTMARLKRGVTLEQAQAELDVLAANLAAAYPATNQGGGLLVRDLGAYINRNLAPMLHLLLGAVGCVLLIACANVANLLLSRAQVRQREITIRAALGAGRARIVRQLLVESIVLAGLGGAAGVLLAHGMMRFVKIYGPAAGTDLARLAHMEIDLTVLAFTLGFSLITGILFGLAPAWLSSRTDLSTAMKQGNRGAAEGGARGGLRSGLVVLEVMLAFVLLAGAGLLVRSFNRLADVDPGFVSENVALMQLNLNGRNYGTPAQRIQFTDTLLERIAQLPGVSSAAVSAATPFNNPSLVTFNVTGRAPGTVQPTASFNFITPEYFQTLRIRLLRGRGFEARDGVSGPSVIVINETLAKQYFPDQDPLGQQLSLESGPNAGPLGEIVGVVSDVMQGTVGAPPTAQFYVPWTVFSSHGLHVLVRTQGDPATLLPLLRSQVHGIDANQPVGATRTLTESMANALAGRRLMVLMLSLFSLIAFIIAAVGIYGVMAYSVSRRTMEFGIRMALGAGRRTVLQAVLLRGLALVGIGLGLGLGASLLLGRVLQSLLYDLSPRDPVTLAMIGVLLVTVAFLACLIPAMRATKVDPVVALRSE
jgi:putative ABC transport system permease protein